MSASCPEQLLSLEAWWNLRRGNRLMPQRSDFTPEILRPWLGNLAVVAVEGDQAAPRFRVTLSGNRLDEYRGFGITGRYVEEVHACGPRTVQHFELCAATGQPVRFLHDNSRNSLVFPQLAKLLLPLAGADGQVSHILMSQYPLAANDSAALMRRVTA
jgi:hypothetical protein